MMWLYTALVLILLVIHTLACYVDRIYSELGKFLSREFQDNMEVWEQQIEPTLGFARDRLALCAAVLAQLSFAAIVLIFGAMVFGREGEVDRVIFRLARHTWRTEIILLTHNLPVRLTAI